MSPLKSSDVLVQRVRELCRSPVVPKPWRATELLEVLEATVDRMEKHSEFFLKFMNRLSALSPDQDESSILKKFADHVAALEPSVSSADPHHRDHLSHVTHVFLFGWAILNGVLIFSEPPSDWRPYGWNSRDRFDKLNRAWLFGSLLHDWSSLGDCRFI